MEYCIKNVTNCKKIKLNLPFVNAFDSVHEGDMTTSSKRNKAYAKTTESETMNTTFKVVDFCRCIAILILAVEASIPCPSSHQICCMAEVWFILLIFERKSIRMVH